MRLAFAILGFAATLSAQRLGDDEAAALIEKARLAALNYSSTLPDFICTQLVNRYQDPRGDNRWQRLDQLTVKLSFFEHHEEYKLMEIDGKPTVLDYMNTGGPTSKGEFGSILLLLFDPKTAAEFRWKGWTTIHKQHAAVFTFKVDKKHSQFHVFYGPVVDGPNHILAPYYGEVAVRPDSGEILRVSNHAILPPGFPIRESSSQVEYDYSEVGGRRYLLPLHAEATMASGRYKSHNVVEFKDFRKFQSDATISFDK